jgi:hypothetical protein
MYGDLEKNRIQMSSLQKTIETQQTDITKLYSQSQNLLGDIQERQKTVDSTVSNFSQRIAAQNKEIQSVEQLFRGMLVRKEEKFTFNDTNRVVFIRKSDSGVIALIRLDAEPIPGFIDSHIRNGIDDIGLIQQFNGNVFTMTISSDLFKNSVRSHGIIVKYVPDPTKKRVDDGWIIQTNYISINGTHFIIPDTMKLLLPENSTEEPASVQ